MRTGGKILVDQLISRGTNQVFCVPGESYLEILNAFYDVPDKVKVYNARHEAGAANMAEAYGKLTRSPGVVLVTRGPGACHASIGVHIAYQDSTPMILIIGQVSQSTRDREAFQEINYQAMFGPISKWCAQIDRVERIPEYIAKAYNLAISGRPGPVVLSVPENILNQTSHVADTVFTRHCEPAPEKSVKLSLEELFAKSTRPLILVGGSPWSEKASANLLLFAMKNSIPVASGFRRQDVFDNNSSVFCGAFGTSVSPSLLTRVKEADLLIVVGSRLGEMTTQGYEIFDQKKTKQKLIHVHVDSQELGAVFSPDFGVVSTNENFSELLLVLDLPKNVNWNHWCKLLHSEYLSDFKPSFYSGALNLGKIFNYLNLSLPKDAVITLDAGNHTGWPQRFLSYSPERRQIGPTCGAMGYSVPAAVAAALALSNKQVIGFVGDGGFMMSGMELMTAVQYEVPLIIVLFNNGSYGTIRMHQEREHPGRVIATDLQNPDFRAMAIAMGAHGELVETTDNFIPAFERCLRQKKPSLIELKTDINQLSTRYILKPN
ncbi:MAG: thiamine pyrophosphate-binding protein [Paracoccaceae bacterium]|nr:thiamine pyrophosphate-binding protein [Paracoccaceae bacterium]